MDPDRQPWKRLTLDAVLACALLLAGILGRLRLLQLSEYPLGDGGMFYVMVQALLENRFSLPAIIPYNGLQIPWAYPPLSFHLAAAAVWLGADLMSVLKWLPVIFSTAALAWVYLFGRQFFRDKTRGFMALALFAFEAQNVYWNWSGGGLARSLGQFCSLAVLYFIQRYANHGQRRDLLLGSAFTALAVVSHPEGALLSFLGGYLILTFFLERGKWRALGLFALLSLLFSAPYWITVLVRHGPGVYTAAYISGVSGQFSAENFVLLGILLLGALAPWIWSRLKKSQSKTSQETGSLDPALLFLIVWTIMVVFLLPRAFRNVYVPVSLFKAWLFYALLDPALKSILAKQRLTAVMLAGGMSILAILTVPGFVSHLEYGWLKPGDLDAMQWVKTRTPAGARFLVVQRSENWATSYLAEWFPALTGRRSLLTAQGREWLPDGSWYQMARAHNYLMACAGSDAACLEQMEADLGLQVDYIYLKQDPVFTLKGYLTEVQTSLPLAVSLQNRPEYEPVFRNPEAVIYRRK